MKKKSSLRQTSDAFCRCFFPILYPASTRPVWTSLRVHPQGLGKYHTSSPVLILFVRALYQLTQSLDSLAPCHDPIHAKGSNTTEEKEQEGVDGTTQSTQIMVIITLRLYIMIASVQCSIIIETIRMGKEATHRGRGKSPEIMPIGVQRRHSID